MAVRVRNLDHDGSVIAEGRCTVSLVDATSGTTLVLPDAVYRELSDLEASATEYC
jgi:acyl-CoA thioesterase FadM